jgi:hypothetical protein
MIHTRATLIGLFAAAHFPIGQGVDAAAFDPESGLDFTSSGEGTLGVFHQKSADE